MSFMYSEEIWKEVDAALSIIEEKELYYFMEELQNAQKIFCDGLGRSGLVCRGFAMRLMHLGFTSMYVGDTVTTAIGEKDLLLICSGSGESETLISHAGKAKKRGARVAVVTGRRESVLGKMADTKIVISAPPKDGMENDFKSILPMGTLFEGVSAMIFENIVLELMKQRNETGQTMFMRHANLE